MNFLHSNINHLLHERIRALTVNQIIRIVSRNVRRGYFFKTGYEEKIKSLSF